MTRLRTRTSMTRLKAETWLTARKARLVSLREAGQASSEFLAVSVVTALAFSGDAVSTGEVVRDWGAAARGRSPIHVCRHQVHVCRHRALHGRLRRR
jgi:hypothetical protein